MPERRVEYQPLTQGQLVGLQVQAPSLQRLFIDAGLAFSDYRISLELVKETQKQAVSVTGPHLAGLMQKWISALADLFQEHGYLPYRIVFTHFDGKRLEATLWERRINRPATGMRDLVKRSTRTRFV
jgi:SHS2 domain-containing protein